MKQSVITGAYIYSTIDKLYNELKELNKALETIEDEMGRNVLAYKLLNDNRLDKQREIEKLKDQKFVIQHVGDLSFE